MLDFGATEEDETRSPWKALQEAYEPFKSGPDALELGERFGLPKPELGPAGTGIGIVNGMMDTYKFWTGEDRLKDGIRDGNLETGLHGAHDMLEGGSGILGNIDGDVGAFAKSFGMGFSFGDAIAPSVFSDHDRYGTDQDGRAYAHTGNGAIDDVIDGAHQMSDGDYADGLLHTGEGALSAAETVLELGANPAVLASHLDAEDVERLGKKYYDAQSALLNPFGGLSERAGEGLVDLFRGE